MKIFIAAGGTGGHFYPGLAVAQSLVKDGHSVTFVIKKGDYVMPMLERESMPYVTLSAAGFKRSFSLSNIMAAGKVAMGIKMAHSIFSQLRPDALLVMGGYLSFAPALAAKMLQIPVILHEQNAVPGLANKIIAKFAQRIAVSFKESLPVFGEKAILTGNPVRSEFRLPLTREDALLRWGLDPSKKTVLIFGGSLGAQKINSLAVESLKHLAEGELPIQFLHFTGPSDEKRVKAGYAKGTFQYFVSGYCNEMHVAYAAADFVVCRAGASTLAELVAVRKPALLIPYPHATAQHQTRNAETLVHVGAAMLREQKNINAAKLGAILSEVIFDDKRIEMMSAGYESLQVRPFQSADLIKEIVIDSIYGS